eukprot:gb/GFBE01021037.1/.p1 GENE.gb/GFBE01021037.1/~~gb/GFBE01021037.1/.p1  ORF type:complete len:390 (+),score=53.62 gb/GFBE01021037.1/:1-1170(+)
MSAAGAAAMPHDAMEEHGAQGSRPVSGSSVQEILPFNPPEAVRKWLRPADWEALSAAWAEAESHAMQWSESEIDGLDDGFWDQEQAMQMQAMGSPSWQQGMGYTQEMARKRRPRKRPDWDQDFNLLGSDSRKPAPLRRYFDEIPAETAPPKEAIRPGMRPKNVDYRHVEDDRFEALLYGRGWLGSHEQCASVDNDGLHPHLRHYFDQRGIESTYRQRPHIDHPWDQMRKPRTPERPPDRELHRKILARGCGSTATLPDPNEPPKAIHWGTRCLRYGPDPKVRQGQGGEKIPWVYDHNRLESEDNTVMNPLLRHYFDADGIESSFRNRGRQYGRAVKSVFGREFSKPGKPKPVSMTSIGNASTAIGSATSSLTLQASQSSPNLSHSSPLL